MVQSPRGHVIFQDVYQINRCLVSRLYPSRDVERKTIIPRKGLVSPPIFLLSLTRKTLIKAITNLNSSWMSWVHRPLMNSTQSPRDDQRNISVLLLLERRFRLGNCTLKPRRKLLISWIILWLVCLSSYSSSIWIPTSPPPTLCCHSTTPPSAATSPYLASLPLLSPPSSS